MRQPINNQTKENEAIETKKVSQDSVAQQPITTETTFTSTLSVKINQPENTEEDKEKEEFVNFLKGFTETRRQKFSEPLSRKPFDKNKVTDLESTKEEEFKSFSESFTDSRRGILSTPILRKRSDKKVEKKDEEQVSNLKQESIETHELLEKMLIKLKTEPTNAVSYEDKNKIKNILCEIQNTSSEKVIEDIKNIINNNKLTITKKTLTYLNENLGKFIVNKTSKVDDEVLIQGGDNTPMDE